MTKASETESEMFQRSFADRTAGCVRECACGRIHFDASEANGWTWDEGEFEKLLELQKQKPDLYLSWDYAIGGMIIDGNLVVYDCPCGYAAKCEKFIRKNAESIKQYLAEWAKELKAKAEAINPV